MFHVRRGTLIPAASWLLAGFGFCAADELDYGKEIQPLLAEHCYACHGPDAKTRKRGLRFDVREVAVRALKSGAHAIVPGDVDASEMVRRLFSTDLGGVNTGYLVIVTPLRQEPAGQWSRRPRRTTNRWGGRISTNYRRN